MSVDFIGVGTQRSATSWLYSCFYEHPEVCSPEKEIHFFSRPRYEEKGIDWYKNIFSTRCAPQTVKGEFSTSYLSHPEAAKRIYKHFPDAKILVSLRKPSERAFSQYLMHAKVGWLDPEETSFKEFVTSEVSAKDQSLYYQQLKRFYDIFSSEQIHVMVKERIDTEPEMVLRELFTFLEVDPDFKPTFLNRVVNSGNRPRRFWINQFMHQVSEYLYKHGFDKLLFAIKKTGLPAYIRQRNSAGKTVDTDAEFLQELNTFFAADISKTAELTGLPLHNYWS